jgi:CDP-glucose 4,6-dehydratase
LEPVFGYLQLATLLTANPLKFSGAWNFGPFNADNLPVINIAQQAIATWGKGKIDQQVDRNAVHEAGLLKLDISKAINELGWKPAMNTAAAIERTIRWYKSFYEEGKTASALLEADFLFYQTLFVK